MAIYRGPGGSGDAVNDSSSETRLAVEARDAALAAQAAAEAAQTAAELAETNAETAETNAETAETNAETAATNAASSASSASTSATNAASSASSASTSATNAASSASSASTSATNAASSASSASTSATSASNSASAASTSASNAATSATAAQAAQAAAEAAFDAFDDIYLGAKSSNPTVDNDGNALTTGDQYFNTVSNELRVWNGSSWQAASVIGGTVTSLTVTGATALNGGATLGDASGDALTINSSAVSIPNGLNFDSNTFVIDATNNRVGVGVLNPAQTLDVQSASGGTTARLRNTTGNFIDFIETSGSSRTGYIGTTNGTNFVIHNDKAGQMQFDTNNIERMRITDTGNVGIGTSSPSQKLDVAGSLALSTNATYLYGKTSGGTATRMFGINGANALYIGGIDTALNSILFTNNGVQMTLDASGNLGIGTSSPAAKLQVNGNSVVGVASSDRLETGGLGTGVAYVQAYGAANAAINLAFYTGTTEKMRLDSSGNLLLGKTTNTIGSKLNVNGTLSETVSSTEYLVASQYDIGTAPNKIPLNQYLGSMAYQNKEFISVDSLYSSGNVGIGTSSPTQLLEVKGNIVGRTSTSVNSNSDFRLLSGAYTGNAATIIEFDGISGSNTINYGGNTGLGEPATSHKWYTGTAGSLGVGTVRMTLDSSGNLGIGTSSPSTKLNVYQYGAIGATIDRAGDYGQSVQLVRNGITGNVGFGLAEQNQLGFYLNSTEGMRFTTTGLGIGTSSPATKLHIVGTNTTNRGQLSIQSDSAGSEARISLYDGTDYIGEFGTTGTSLYAYSAGNLLFYAGSTLRSTLDSSGNLGLGVTPSAWGSIFKTLEFPNGSAVAAYASAGNSEIYTLNNAYYDGASWRYKITGIANRFQLAADASFRWYNAASGTAGNAITFTQAMTLDSAGNLGIGSSATSPSAKVDVSPGSSYASDVTIKVTSSYADGYRAGVQLNNTYTGGRAYTLFSTNNSDGGFGGGKFVIYDTTASAGRLVIDSSGNLLVGVTSTSAPNSSGGVVIFPPSAGGGITSFNTHANWSAFGVTSGATGTETAIKFYYGTTPTVVGTITITGSSTAYNTSSDYRLKENIAPMTGALATVAQLKPVTYNWKADGSNGQGFIAHELQAVVPDCVTGEKDAVDADGNPVYQGIDTSFLVATLTAAIQELNAKVIALEAQLNK